MHFHNNDKYDRLEIEYIPFAFDLDKVSRKKNSLLDNKIKNMKLIRSRTVWVIVLMFLVGGTSAVEGYIPAGYLTLIQGILGVLAIYFRLNPSQSYDR